MWQIWFASWRDYRRGDDIGGLSARGVDERREAELKTGDNLGEKQARMMISATVSGRVPSPSGVLGWEKRSFEGPRGSVLSRVSSRLFLLGTFSGTGRGGSLRTARREDAVKNQLDRAGD